MPIFSYVAPTVLFINLVVYICIFHKFGFPSGKIQKDENFYLRKRVLVTGGAGFIGYHLSRHLLLDNAIVVVVDNFNKYYDLKLKIDRAHRLLRKGVYVRYLDICDANRLKDLWKEFNFTHVVHLAAQAGVRVYGHQAGTPFAVGNRTSRPANIYAATKLTDELLAQHYCDVHGVRSIGLRFFTVYGPWGRPDMAVYKFAKAIYSRESLPLFHSSDSGSLRRDFTYIDDVVQGITAAIRYDVISCDEVFNLGFGQPVSVAKLIRLLEQNLGLEAQIQYVPMPPTELPVTWADITKSKEKLGFRPTVNIETGVSQFVRWFLDYTKRRRVAEANDEFCQAREWFDHIAKPVYTEPEVEVCMQTEKP